MVYFIDSQSQLEFVIPNILRYDILALDVETRGLNPRRPSMVTLQIGTGDDEYVFDVRRVNVHELLELIHDTNKLVCGHSLKFDLSFLKVHYNSTYNRLYDTMLAQGILKNGLESPYVSLTSLTSRYLNVDLNKDIRDTFLYTYGPLTEEQIEYAAADVRYLIHLMKLQISELQRDDLLRTARLEFSLIPVVTDMELTGIKLDVDKWLEETEKNRKLAEQLSMEIANAAGDNIVQESFFAHLNHHSIRTVFHRY